MLGIKTKVLVLISAHGNLVFDSSVMENDVVGVQGHDLKANYKKL